MIRYTFAFDDTNEIDFDVDLQTDFSLEEPTEQYPEWTWLDRFRCDVCTIPSGARRTCPAALAIRPVIDVFGSRVSFETVLMAVTRDEVKLEARISNQRAMRSLMGLLLPLSACPVMMRLRPMALLHLPLSSRQQTAYRFLGMHFIAQYLRQRQGETPDWELRGLHELLEQVRLVNVKLAQRIRGATEADATVNALVLLDAFADSVALNAEQSLAQLEPLFSAYLAS